MLMGRTTCANKLGSPNVDPLFEGYPKYEQIQGGRIMRDHNFDNHPPNALHRVAHGTPSGFFAPL